MSGGLVAAYRCCPPTEQGPRFLTQQTLCMHCCRVWYAWSLEIPEGGTLRKPSNRNDWNMFSAHPCMSSVASRIRLRPSPQVLHGDIRGLNVNGRIVVVNSYTSTWDKSLNHMDHGSWLKALFRLSEYDMFDAHQTRNMIRCRPDHQKEDYYILYFEIPATVRILYFLHFFYKFDLRIRQQGLFGQGFQRQGSRCTSSNSRIY